MPVASTAPLRPAHQPTPPRTSKDPRDHHPRHQRTHRQPSGHAARPTSGNTTSTPPADLKTQIRDLIATARHDGRPAPGRPTLVRLTGATDHAVRTALHQLAAERTHDHQTTTPDPGGDQTPHDSIDHQVASRTTLALVTTNPGEPDHQQPPAGDPSYTSTTSAGGHPNRQITSSGGSTSPITSTGDQHTSHTASTGEPDHQHAPGGGRLVAWTGFLFGSITSIAANVLHAWLPAAHQPPGWTPGLPPQLGAAVWPIGLMIAVEAVTRIHWPEGFGWSLARFGGGGTVALGSAVISYGHLRDLLEAWQYTSLAAAVGPLVLDGLMVVCGFALLASSVASQHPSPPDDHR
jgi:Protein of unknown function (DUF2637)